MRLVLLHFLSRASAAHYNRTGQPSKRGYKFIAVPPRAQGKRYTEGVKWLAFVLSAIPTLAQNGVVQGTVIDAVTKAPIAGASVKLYQAFKAVHSANTNVEGVFRIDGVADGQYHSDVDHVGHMSLAPGQIAARTFLVSAANPKVQLSAELLPMGRLRGRILYSLGEPVRRTPVGMRRSWDDHWTQLGVSDDDGQFHFNYLEPGTWILAALPHLQITSSQPENDPKPVAAPEQEESVRIGWAATYSPGVVDMVAAEKIVVSPGAALEGYNIKLRTTRILRVSGQVLDDIGRPAPKAAVSLLDVINRGANSIFKTADGDGKFEFDSVREGEWRIFSQLEKSGKSLKGYASLQLSRHDVSGIEVRLAAPFSVKGLVDRKEPVDSEGNRKTTAVYLIPQDASPEVEAGSHHEQDGSFVLNKVYAGRYRVLPAGFVPGFYLSEIWYGEREVTTQPIEIVNPVLTLKIVYKPGAPRATGTVERGEGAWVALVPQDEAFRDIHQFIRVAQCDANGRFSMDGLRPGGYYAFAFDRIVREMFEDPDFVRRLASGAGRVDLRHGETASLELRLQVWPDY